MFYKGKVHKRIFEEQINKNNSKSSNKYLAALYLICAEKKLWNIARPFVTKRKIDFAGIAHYCLSINGYTLFSVAQDIYTGSTHLTFKEIYDKYIIDELMFEMILTALRIARDGYSFVGISKKFN